MFIVKYRKIFYAFTTLVMLFSVGAIFVYGVKFSIDFTGGTLSEFSYQKRPAKEQLIKELDKLQLGNYSLREAGQNSFILRTQVLKLEKQKALTNKLQSTGAKIDRYTDIGPTIGKELRAKAWIAIVLVVIAIILFIAFVFRHVSKPVSSWKYGLIAILALIHDITIPFGVFAILGHTQGAEIDILFVMALLAILGYSVNDTIVIFDRVRERLKENREGNRKESFEETVGNALAQTMTRSINTSLTTIITLLALYFVGAQVTQHFALVLLAGIIAGTYSSIALAAPLLVSIKRFRK